MQSMKNFNDPVGKRTRSALTNGATACRALILIDDSR